MEQQLYFITGIVGVILLLLVSIMNYYIFKFKRNFETEQANRIKFETQSEQLKDELAIVQTEFEEEKSKGNRLEENLEVEQASRRQHEAESENLQRQLNTTQAGLEQKQNEVYQLQENLQAERASWITESKQLQHELATIQAELEQKEDRGNRLEENLEAKQAESEQLQGELNITQVELREKQDEVNHLEEDLQTERESRIQYQTESENLQRELSKTQAELKQKGSKIDHLEGNLQAEQAESQQLQRQLNITQGELQKTQTELKQKENENNQLQDNLQAEQAKFERLQHELNTTQTELGEKENEVNHLEENLQIERESRIQYQTEFENLQRELSTIQAELEQKESEVSRLQQNLQAERVESERLQRELNANQAKLEETQNEVKHLEKKFKAKQAESEQLQRELNTIQEELDEKENKINRLEENLQAEQQSRIQYETESQQLQQELATTHQIELDKQKNIINRLEEKIKEKSDNRVSTEQSDIQEVEENSTDSDEPQNQENTGIEPDSQIDSTGACSTETKNKTGQTGNTKAPQNRGGLRGPGSNGSEDSTDYQTEYNPKPELACRKNGWQWEIVLVAPQEHPPVEVQQNGARLSGSNGEYRLTDFSEDVTIMYGDNEETVKVYNDKSPLIFKLRKRWKGDGQKVGGLSCGYFIVFAPNDWPRTGKPPVVEEACSDVGFSAHYFYSDGSSTDDGFEGYKLPSNEEGFSLEGSSIYDDSEQGPLFIGNPPSLAPMKDVFWARIGAEGGRDWKGENFKPADKTVKEVLNGQQGWFYVRVYDEAVQLMDSDHFRYSQTLKEIRVNGTIYSEKMLLVPSGRHRKTTIQFIDTEGKNICPEKTGSNPYTSINDDGEAIVARHPDADLTEWKVGGVDTVIVLPRVWWRITGTEDFSDEWRDAPIVMSRDKFLDHTDAVVQISVPSNINKIKAGFDPDLDRSYNATANDENKYIFELPIRDFVDYDEINTRLLEDTCLQVQCDREEIPIICVPAEEPLLREIRVNGIVYSDEMLLVPSTNESGKAIGYGKTIIKFIDTEGKNIRPKKKGNNSRASIRNDEAVIVEPHPDGDLTEWTVDNIDTVIRLPRVWWRIMETDDFSDEWRDTPIVMPREEFRENRNAVVHISLPPNIQTIQVGFDYSLRRSYRPTFAAENRNRRVALRIRDLDYQEIERPSSRSIYLNIQCNGEVLSIIRVPGEGEICPRCDSSRLIRIYSDNGNLMEYQCAYCPWVSQRYPRSAVQITEE